MAGLRGPDSSKDAQLLDERAVFPETVDVNIRQLDPIPAPRYFLKELPLTNEMSDLVLKSRQEIRDVLHGRDDRLLAIVGPCSIHDPKAAHEYAERLAAVKKELDDRLVIVMRVYFEKPRTTIGWKGLINDPDLDGQFNIQQKLIKDIAQKEPCVIVGRCADYILSDRDDVLNVFIEANKPEKAARIKKLYHKSDD